MKNLNEKLLVFIGTAFLFSSSLLGQSSYNANSSPVSGSANAGFGMNALNNTGSGDYNTAVGTGALNVNGSGQENCAVGLSALANNTNGNSNTGMGLAVLLANTSGAENTALGYHTLWSNSTRMGNTAIGARADALNGNYNSILGYRTMVNGGDNNLVGGTGALVTAGNRNVVLGNISYANSGDDNISIGSQAWTDAGTYGSTAIGHGANVGTLSFFCTAVGTQATIAPGQGSASAFGMNSYAKGLESTAIGAGSFVNGDKTTALGRNSNASFINSTAVGESAITFNPNQVMIGSPFIAQIGGWVPYTNFSDGRFKSDVKSEDVKGLEFINLLRPVVYTFETNKLVSHITKHMPDSLRKNYLNRSKVERRQSGFIAQEVQEAAKKSNYNFSGVTTPENEDGVYVLAYSDFVVPLVKGMQEQQAMIETLKQQVEDQKQMISSLQDKIGSATGLNQLQNGENGFAMAQNIPNPFSNETVVKYTLTAQTKSAVLNVYDLTGKQITSFALSNNSSSVTITSEKLAAGIYIYSIVADGKIMDSKRMVVAEK